VLRAFFSVVVVDLQKKKANKLFTAMLNIFLQIGKTLLLDNKRATALFPPHPTAALFKAVKFFSGLNQPRLTLP
jgi:hypothetical protein